MSTITVESSLREDLSQTLHQVKHTIAEIFAAKNLTVEEATIIQALMLGDTVRQMPKPYTAGLRDLAIANMDHSLGRVGGGPVPEPIDYPEEVGESTMVGLAWGFAQAVVAFEAIPVEWYAAALGDIVGRLISGIHPADPVRVKNVYGLHFMTANEANGGEAWREFWDAVSLIAAADAAAAEAETAH